jgi:hypothetical protein
MLESRIRAIAPPGTLIPKPEAQGEFRIKGDGFRRGQRARVYTIPNNKNSAKPYEKGVTWAEFDQAYAELYHSGRLTTAWFKQNFKACYDEGSCNFTTVGGLFELLGDAEYERRGVYRLKVTPSSQGRRDQGAVIRSKGTLCGNSCVAAAHNVSLPAMARARVSAPAPSGLQTPLTAAPRGSW